MSAVPVPITASDPLAHAIEDYISAKREEDAATKLRIYAEERILALCPAKEEGSQTTEVGGYKLTVTGKLTYSCEDPKAMAEVCAAAGWPASMIPVKTSVTLDATGAKWLRANEPQAWETLARFVTVKPAKTSIAVKV